MLYEQVVGRDAAVGVVVVQERAVQQQWVADSPLALWLCQRSLQREVVSLSRDRDIIT